MSWRASCFHRQFFVPFHGQLVSEKKKRIFCDGYLQIPGFESHYFCGSCILDLLKHYLERQIIINQHDSAIKRKWPTDHRHLEAMVVISATESSKKFWSTGWRCLFISTPAYISPYSSVSVWILVNVLDRIPVGEFKHFLHIILHLGCSKAMLNKSSADNRKWGSCGIRINLQKALILRSGVSVARTRCVTTMEESLGGQGGM